jgi:hypothetical protein
MCVRRGWIVAVALASLAGCAHASDPPPLHRIEVQGTDAVKSIELRTQHGAPMDCGDDCAVDVRPGPLYVLVRDKQNSKTVARLDVPGPTHVTVAPGNNHARVLGGALTIVGIGAVALGGTSMVAAVVRPWPTSYCDQACEEDQDRWLMSGAITLAAGLATGAAGLVLWRRYGTAQVSEAPVAAPPPEAAQLRLTPAVGPRWTGLALGGSF